MVQQTYLSDREESRPRLERTPRTDVMDRGLRDWLVGLGSLWWCVVVVVLLAVGAEVYATTQTPTTYTGRSSLIVNSNGRSPDQDAVLVQGYVDYFNNPSYQKQLAEQAGLTSPVSLTARSAASSPILVVESTVDKADFAQSSAAKVAETFRTDINQVMDKDQADGLKELQDRLDKAIEAGGVGSSTAATLQDQIAQRQDDRTNRLQELQLRGGVATNTPSMVSNVAQAAFSGLVAGVLLVLVIGALRSRRRRRKLRTR
jgi:hypothetical protein